MAKLADLQLSQRKRFSRKQSWISEASATAEVRVAQRVKPILWLSAVSAKNVAETVIDANRVKGWRAMSANKSFAIQASDARTLHLFARATRARRPPPVKLTADLTAAKYTADAIYFVRRERTAKVCSSYNVQFVIMLCFQTVGNCARQAPGLCMSGS